jgi:hypothetical protein
MVSAATAIDQRRSTWGGMRCAALATDMHRIVLQVRCRNRRAPARHPRCRHVKMLEEAGAR